jgi:surface protein
MGRQMKTIDTYINEKLRLTTKRTYTCQPKDKIELRKIIIDRIKNEGPTCDLNDIDTSQITDMSSLFYAASDSRYHAELKNFNGDISMWDVSNVENIYSMFYHCYKFNCDLSSWDVSNIKSMAYAFYNCKKFNQNLDSWNVSNVKYMRMTFGKCPTKLHFVNLLSIQKELRYGVRPYLSSFRMKHVLRIIY